MYVIYYSAIADFFRLNKWGGQPVPVVFASPDRAHQEIRRVMRVRRAGSTMPGVAVTTQADEDRPFPVPFFSLYISSPQFNQALWNPGRYTICKDPHNRTAMRARHPMPMTADVQVDLWCGSDAGNLIAYNIEPQTELRFMGGYTALPIDWSLSKWYKPPFNMLDHARYFGRTAFRLHTKGWKDTSGLEYGDGPKTIRRTWTGLMHALIPYRAEEARLIADLSIAVCDAMTGELYGTVVAGVED